MIHNTLKYIALFVVLVSVGLTGGCRSDTTTPTDSTSTPITIAPGQTTIPLDAFTLRAPPADGATSACGSSDADLHPCPPVVKDVCYWVRNATSIAIIEVIEQIDHISFNIDPCAEPYGNNDTYIAHARVLAVAAGEEVPMDLRVVFLNDNWPLHENGPLLVRLTRLEGEWFGTEVAAVMTGDEQLNPNAPDSDRGVVYELPDNFADLANETMDAIERFGRQCPNSQLFATEEELVKAYKFPDCGVPDRGPGATDAGLEADAD